MRSRDDSQVVLSRECRKEGVNALSRKVEIVRSAMGCWMRKRRTWFGGGGQEDADWKAVHLDLTGRWRWWKKGTDWQDWGRWQSRERACASSACHRWEFTRQLLGAGQWGDVESSRVGRTGPGLRSLKVEVPAEQAVGRSVARI